MKVEQIEKFVEGRTKRDEEVDKRFRDIEKTVWKSAGMLGVIVSFVVVLQKFVKI